MTKAKAIIRIGCSGWSYPDWRRRVYAASLAEREWFSFYARVFDTVEINNSFYQLPSAKTVAHWQAQAPRGFVYAVKVNRYITHMKKLKEPARALDQFYARMDILGRHLGPLLYQLPPNWRCDVARLGDFLALLPAGHKHVFEFRHPSWIADHVFALIEKHGASVCVHDMSGIEMPRLAVGPVAYVRFHGTRPGYGGGYPERTLRSWAGWMREQARRGFTVFAYFNNDVGGHAFFDAQRLRQQVAKV